MSGNRETTNLSRLRDLAWRLRPGASRRVQRGAIVSLWSAVGLALGAAGVAWCLQAGLPAGAGLVLAGLFAGALKGHFVLRRSARRIARRIAQREDGSCLGGALSWPTWMLVALMMASGIALRHSTIPRPVLGPLYVAVGAALLAGAWHLARFTDV